MRSRDGWNRAVSVGCRSAIGAARRDHRPGSAAPESSAASRRRAARARSIGSPQAPEGSLHLFEPGRPACRAANGRRRRLCERTRVRAHGASLPFVPTNGSRRARRSRRADSFRSLRGVVTTRATRPRTLSPTPRAGDVNGGERPARRLADHAPEALPEPATAPAAERRLPVATVGPEVPATTRRGRVDERAVGGRAVDHPFRRTPERRRARTIAA